MIDKKLLPEYIADAPVGSRGEILFRTFGCLPVFLGKMKRSNVTLRQKVRRLSKSLWEDAPLRMAEFLSENLIFLDLDAPDKASAFRVIVEGMAHHGAISAPSAFLSELLEREAIEPTCMGRGVAFPHARTELVKRPVIAFARARTPISFSNSTTDDVLLIFVMATPKSENNLYLNILSRLCKMLRQPEFRDALISAKTASEALELIEEKELQDLERQHIPSLVS